MLKQDLTTKVGDSLKSYLKRDIDQAIDIILATIAAALDEGKRVEIRGFGSFVVRQHLARSVKNPATGKVMEIPPRKTVHFAMSKSLKNPLVKK